MRKTTAAAVATMMALVMAFPAAAYTSSPTAKSSGRDVVTSTEVAVTGSDVSSSYTISSGSSTSSSTSSSSDSSSSSASTTVETSTLTSTNIIVSSSVSSDDTADTSTGSTSGTTTVLVDATIHDSTTANDDLVAAVESGGLVVTTYNEISTASETVAAELASSYEQISSVSSVASLAEEVNTQLEAIKAEQSVSSSITADDMVVRELFNISLNGEYYNNAVSATQNYLKTTLNLGLSQSSVVMIMVRNAAGVWNVLPPSQYTVNADGSVTACFYELGTVAVLTNKVTGPMAVGTIDTSTTRVMYSAR